MNMLLTARFRSASNVSQHYSHDDILQKVENQFSSNIPRVTSPRVLLRAKHEVLVLVSHHRQIRILINVARRA